MSKRMKELLAMAGFTMAMASVGESPARMPRKPIYELTNKEKKKCKSCKFFSKNGRVCSCELAARHMYNMAPMNPACSNYKKKNK